MARLSMRDMQAVLDLVGEAHDAEDLDAFRGHVLPSIREIIPADYAAYNEVFADGQVGASMVVPELPPGALDAWARYAWQNPLVQRYQKTRDGRAYRFSDVISPGALHRLELYQQLYRPIGTEHQVAVALPAPPALVLGLVLTRGGRDFSERDRAVLNLARPHLIQAYRNVELRERLLGLVDALARGLDDSGEAVVAVGGDGRVQFVNRSGAAAVAEAIGMPPKPGRTLPPPLYEWVAARREEPLLLANNGRRYVVRRLAPADGGIALLVLESASQKVSREVLEGLGLSTREAEVLQGMMRGLSTLEIAARMEITRGTVYKHAERIFAKLGVHDRVEAVAVAWAATRAGAGPRRS